MSKLTMFGRPYVLFDAKNKEHRKWFSEFNKRRSWGDCPVRFIVNEDSGDLLTQIQRELIQYYVNSEFNNGKSYIKIKKVLNEKNQQRTS